MSVWVWLKDHQKFAVAVAVATLVVTVMALTRDVTDFKLGASDAQAPRVETSTSTPPTPPSTTTTTTTAPSGSSPAPTSDGVPPGSASEVRPLTVTDAVATKPCLASSPGGSRWSDSASPLLGGQRYTRGLSCPPVVPDGNGYLDFVVPHGFTRLTGAVGINDDSELTTITIEATVQTVPEQATPLFTTTLTYSDVAEVDLSGLHGTLRLRLGIRVIDADRPDREWATVTWADMRFGR